jgi:hypothetical protein
MSFQRRHSRYRGISRLGRVFQNLWRNGSNGQLIALDFNRQLNGNFPFEAFLVIFEHERNFILYYRTRPTLRSADDRWTGSEMEWAAAGGTVEVDRHRATKPSMSSN